MADVREDFERRLRVKVVKEVPDDRTSLCGEPLQDDGKTFIIPAHFANFVKENYPNYKVGKEFLIKKKDEEDKEVKKGRPKKEID
ncbi:MAG: hypothetical protein ACOYWZ_20025 [Bacillota bacterium]